MKKIILFTGATSGIGKSAALEFIKKGHNLIIPARNKQKAEDLILEASKIGVGEIKYYDCDLSSQKSIKNFVSLVKNDFESIDILANNAGIWNNKLKLTIDNIEETFAVNVIAPYLLTELLKPLLELGAEKRIIFTASKLHGGKIHFDDLQFLKNFNGFLAYQQSKLGIILLTKYLAQKYKENYLTVNCFHPGMINTNIGSTESKFMKFIFKTFGSTTEKGAQKLLNLALNEDLSLVSGEYFSDNKIIKTKGETNNFETAVKLVEEIKSLIK